MEDCLFYRDARLVSLNEVGGEPRRFGVSVAEFHQRAAVRAAMWPHTMVALSTHDTKRGEDVRARIGVLSQVPSLWAELVGKWALAVPPPDAGNGTVPVAEHLRGVAGRRHPSPKNFGNGCTPTPRRPFERPRCTRPGTTRTPSSRRRCTPGWTRCSTGRSAAEMTSLVARLDLHARSDALGQKLIALTAPGVPDVYQGTELWEDSLVDPDNRRPVDYATRQEALKSLRHPKIRVVTAALRLRGTARRRFTDGGYTPVLADGPAAAHLVAFLRGDDVLTAVTRHTVLLSETGWGDTSLALPDGQWIDRIGGGRFSGRVLAVELFANLPVALLERSR